MPLWSRSPALEQVRGLAAQNLARQQERERDMLRQKYLTKPLSEIVSGDTEVRPVVSGGAREGSS